MALTPKHGPVRNNRIFNRQPPSLPGRRKRQGRRPDQVPSGRKHRDSEDAREGKSRYQ